MIYQVFEQFGREGGVSFGLQLFYICCRPVETTHLFTNSSIRSQRENKPIAFHWKLNQIIIYETWIVQWFIWSVWSSINDLEIVYFSLSHV